MNTENKSIEQLVSGLNEVKRLTFVDIEGDEGSYYLSRAFDHRLTEIREFVETLLNNVQNVQVSDTTGDDSNSEAGNINK